MFNPFKSHYTFSEDEKLLAFRFKILKTMIVLLIVFSLYFAILYHNGMREVIFFEELARYLHAAIGLILLYVLNRSKSAYRFVSYAIVLVSIIFFTLIMVHVPFDDFRMIWFHTLMVAAFVSYGVSLGLMAFILGTFSLLISYLFFDLQINGETMLTVMISLFILFLVLFFYSRQINEFEQDLLKTNLVLEKLASHDTLTGILNRRVFLEMSQKYLSAAKRKEERVYFLMLDIDYFKKINDTYGHIEGDRVLKFYSQIITNNLRENDLFGRLGGEEFGIVILEESLEGALVVAEKLRKAIENHDYVVDNKSLNLTISIGLAQCYEGLTLEEIMHNADIAMYEAKDRGRNRVVSHEEEA